MSGEGIRKGARPPQRTALLAQEVVPPCIVCTPEALEMHVKMPKLLLQRRLWRVGKLFQRHALSFFKNQRLLS